MDQYTEAHRDVKKLLWPGKIKGLSHQSVFFLGAAGRQAGVLETLSHIFSALASLAGPLARISGCHVEEPGSTPGGGVLKPSAKPLQTAGALTRRPVAPHICASVCKERPLHVLFVYWLGRCIEAGTCSTWTQSGSIYRGAPGKLQNPGRDDLETFPIKRTHLV